MERKLTFEEARKLIEKELEKNLEELKSAYLECEKDSEKLKELVLKGKISRKEYERKLNEVTRKHNKKCIEINKRQNEKCIKIQDEFMSF